MPISNLMKNIAVKYHFYCQLLLGKLQRRLYYELESTKMNEKKIDAEEFDSFVALWREGCSDKFMARCIADWHELPQGFEG